MNRIGLGGRGIAAGDEDVAAGCDARVLIMGATTAVVETLARRVHARSARSGFPFRKVNAAALPDDPTAFATTWTGLLLDAAGGSILVTHSDVMSLPVQHQLLQWIDDIPRGNGGAMVRMMTGTTASLRDCVVAGTFADRLYYRLNLVHLIAEEPKP